MLNPNRVLSKAQILDHVWDYDFRGESGIVESYISYLRRKIDTDGPAADPHQARRRLRAAAAPRGTLRPDEHDRMPPTPAAAPVGRALALRRLRGVPLRSASSPSSLALLAAALRAPASLIVSVADARRTCSTAPTQELRTYGAIPAPST